MAVPMLNGRSNLSKLVGDSLSERSTSFKSASLSKASFGWLSLWVDCGSGPSAVIREGLVCGSQNVDQGEAEIILVKQDAYFGTLN
jgi:hypothetical protein